MKFPSDLKAISTVLATLIIVAVTITVTVAFTFWFGGLTGVFMGWERLEVSNAVASQSGDGWNITFEIVNRGIWDSTFTGVLVNDKPLDAYSGDIALIDDDGNRYTSIGGMSISVKAGSTLKLTIWIKEDGFKHGQTVSITFQSSRGGSFPRQVYLP
ncbi:hypothetical protein KEJ27_10260 [Candidatus Bathyarchaeota archaeon]|nr:hypothetical protein [Candidatus Bathyarchaeota archaeon]MBS7618812.1 hypothetical protein [Candidatus Bathyarchaeota archaeon]